MAWSAEALAQEAAKGGLESPPPDPGALERLDLHRGSGYTQM